jgi:hypothetical protein
VIAGSVVSLLAGAAAGVDPALGCDSMAGGAGGFCCCAGDTSWLGGFVDCADTAVVAPTMKSATPPNTRTRMSDDCVSPACRRNMAPVVFRSVRKSTCHFYLFRWVSNHIHRETVNLRFAFCRNIRIARIKK